MINYSEIIYIKKEEIKKILLLESRQRLSQILQNQIFDFILDQHPKEFAFYETVLRTVTFYKIFNIYPKKFSCRQKQSFKKQNKTKISFQINENFFRYSEHVQQQLCKFKLDFIHRRNLFKNRENVLFLNRFIDFKKQIETVKLKEDREDYDFFKVLMDKYTNFIDFYERLPQIEKDNKQNNKQKTENEIEEAKLVFEYKTLKAKFNHECNEKTYRNFLGIYYDEVHEFFQDVTKYYSNRKLMGGIAVNIDDLNKQKDDCVHLNLREQIVFEDQYF